MRKESKESILTFLILDLFHRLQKTLINHWTKTYKAVGWKGPLEVAWSSPAQSRAYLKSQDPAAQGFARASSEFLWGQWLYRLSGQLFPVFDLAFWRYSALYWIGISLVSTCKIKKYQLWAIWSPKSCKCWQIPIPQCRDPKVELGRKKDLDEVYIHKLLR